MKLSRRKLIGSTIAAILTTPAVAIASTGPAIHVVKGLGCGCCTAWAKILEAEGFQVTTEEIHPADLARIKADLEVPTDLASCHTARIDGYIVEGHVPVADIRRLVEEKPEGIGLAVPGMPYGSPGMGPEIEREAYDVMLFGEQGSRTVFTSYEAQS
ncbi:DUF411 domain-containing protein [Hoeflea sp. CAU 1731]